MSETVNSALAEKLLGYYRDPTRRGPFTDWHESKCGGKGRCAPKCGFNLPLFSEDIAAAMIVVREMSLQGWSFACTVYQGRLPYASFCKGTVKSSRNAEADSLPQAICHAALAALESEN